MADEATPAVTPRQPWWRRLLKELVWLIIGLIALGGIGLVLLDTAPGHRFLADRIAAMETKSGLTVKIGRIEGSIFDEARLKNVEVSDPDGVFLTSPEILLDWAPGAWLYNTLHIDRLEAERLRLLRLPKLRPGDGEGPVLPDFDIFIGNLTVKRVEVAEDVTGTARVGRLEGAADIRAGRAMVDIKAALDGGDALAIKLDAEPGRNRLDLGARVVAPADGVLPAMTGLGKPFELAVTGAGDWANWAGKAILAVEGRESAALDLSAKSGRFGARGDLQVARLLPGVVGRLASGKVRLDLDGTFAERVFDGTVRLEGAAIRAVGRGAVDLGGNAYRDVRIAAEIKRPSALLSRLGGTPLRLNLTLDGGFEDARFAYRVRSSRAQIDKVVLVDAMAEGRGRLSKPPVKVPVSIAARRVSGIGPLVEDILADVRLEGILFVTANTIRADDARLKSRRLAATIDLNLNIKTGEFQIAFDGRMQRYEVPGIGLVDVTSSFNVRPARGGGTQLTGKARAEVQRLDNGFFASLTGGNPVVTADLTMGPDDVLRLDNLVLSSPELTLKGEGIRRADGTFLIEASGEQASYGPVRVTIDGDIARPKVSLLLEKPNAPLGLADVAVELAPTDVGFDFTANGGSRFGPFTANGAILLPDGADAVLDIAELSLAGSKGSGRLTIAPEGFDGVLRLSGGEIGGTITLKPAGTDLQRIALDLTLNRADFPGPPSMQIGKGNLKGVMLLSANGLSFDGRLQAERSVIGGISLAAIDATAKLVDGRGTIDAKLKGRRGGDFDFDAHAAIAPERINLSGSGTLDGRRLEIEDADLIANGGNWRVERAQLRYGGGSATLSGTTGPVPQLDTKVDRLPLQLLDIIFPGLELGGRASGTLSYRGGDNPEGEADLKLIGLSRAGLVLASTPIDAAVKAKLDQRRAGFRAVMESNGQSIGRAQGQFSPLGPGDPIAAILAAPMIAQLRYDGPADTLWRLSGFELFDLSGPMDMAIDMRGSLLAPRISGAIALNNARLESSVSGMVIRQVNARGRFNGSQLQIQSMQGVTPGEGSVSGSGDVTLGAGTIALDLSFDVKKARILDRDDIGATVTGPIRIRSGGNGGTISGDLRLDSGKFQLGQAGTVASVPSIDVIEKGLAEDEVIERARLAPWNLDMSVKGEPLAVRGLGIDSFWSTDLKLGGTVLEPRMTGTAELIRGEYDFAGRNFRLTDGKIRFRGQSPPDPLLDIRAEADEQGIQATVRVQGTGLKPEISFSSVPSLPQDELLSRLLFGTSITNLSAAEALQLGAAVASLQGGGGGLDPINKLRGAVGLDRLRILPADVSTGQKTAIGAGKYITRQLFVEVITDGQGYTASSIEYRITRWLSILATIDSIGRQSANVRVSKDY